MAEKGEKPRENGREDDTAATEKDACLENEKESTRRSSKRRRGSESGRHMRKLEETTGLNKRIIIVIAVLVILVLLLFITVITMAALWPQTPHHHETPVCANAACLRASAQMLPMLNSSISPCRDFPNFACGGWLSETLLPATRSRWGALEQIQYQGRERIHTLITTLPHPTRPDSMTWKLKHFYESCMNLENIEAEKDMPLRKIITNLGGWQVLRTFVPSTWDSTRVLKMLHSEYGVSPFFKIQVAPDYKNSSAYIIQIVPSGLGLPDKNYYYRNPDGSVEGAYKRYLKDAVQLLGATSIDASQFAEDMFHFEKRLAEYTPDIGQQRNPTTHSRLRVSNLKNLASMVPWQELLIAIFPNAKITANTEVIAISESYLSGVSHVLSTTDRGVLNNYLMWSFGSAYIPYLNKDYRDIANLFRQEMTGATLPLERWEFCVKTAQHYMGVAVNALLARNNKHREEDVKAVEGMFEDIHNSAVDRLRGRTQGAELTDFALEKALSVKVQIGLPESAITNTFQDDLYYSFHLQKNDFFLNVRYGVSFLRWMEEKQYMAPFPELQGATGVIADDVLYEAAINAVLVPETLLQPPLFHRSYPVSVQYGGLGVLISQRLVEGVSQTGLIFDAHGRLLEEGDSLLNVSIERLNECQQQGDPTALSTAAHESGVQLAFQAMKVRSGQISHVHQPAMELYENEHLFFISYGQSMCSISTVQQEDLDLTTLFRMNSAELLRTTVTHDPNFSTTFSCSRKSSSISPSCYPLL